MGSQDVVVSADGKSVYVGGSDASSNGMIARFDRATDGSLTYVGCIGDNASQGCVDVPNAPLRGLGGLALSPNGSSLYAASTFSESLTRFARSPDGALTFDRCFSGTGGEGCADVGGANNPMANVSTVTTSPDGSAIYLQGQSSAGRVIRFSADAAGIPAFSSCLATDGSQGCISVTGVPLLGRSEIIATDSSLYAFAGGLGAISRFNRPAFTNADCVSEAMPPACTHVPNRLGLIEGGALSPDQDSLYAVGTTDGGSKGILSRLSINSNGSMVYVGCLADSEPGCQDLANSPIGGANEVAVSPDGESVYVAAARPANDVATFRRSPDGSLAFAGCLGNDVDEGCTAIPGAPMDGANAVAVSPDGRTVYVTSFNSKSISVFNREVAGGGGGGADPFSFGLKAKGKQKVGRLSVKVTCSSACDVLIRAKGRAGSKFKSKLIDAALPAGTYRLKVKLKKNVLRKVDDHRGKVSFVGTATSEAGAEATDTAKAKLKP